MSNLLAAADLHWNHGSLGKKDERERGREKEWQHTEVKIHTLLKKMITRCSPNFPMEALLPSPAKEKSFAYVTSLLSTSALRFLLRCIKKKSCGGNFSLHALPFLLETEAGPAAQFALLLGKVISSRTAGSRLQDVVHLQAKQRQNNNNNNNNSWFKNDCYI